MKIFSFSECESTQKIARQLAIEGQPDLTVVVSEIQTSGVGRQGRVWESNLGGLWMSVILKRFIPIDILSCLALSIGIQTHNALREIGIKTIIKYPNDILAYEFKKQKKLCGVLCQSSIRCSNLDYVIAGLGMNINNIPPPEGTSILNITGIKYNVKNIMEMIIDAIDKSTLRLVNNNKDSILKELGEIGCIQIPLDNY